MKKVTIISCGEELINGSITDTNGSYISSELHQWDLDISRHLVIGDSVSSLHEGISYALKNSDITLITGGLGPTDDDNTVEVISSIYNKRIISDRDSLNMMNTLFKKRNIEIHDYDRKMALYPEGGRVVPNPLGLAPGFIIENNDTCLIALPGVPGEMKIMFHDSVMPFLKEKFHLKQQYTCIIRIAGVKEADINQAVNQILKGEKDIKWGITTQYGLATLSFTINKSLTLDINAMELELKKIFMDKMLKKDFSYPHEELVSDLIEKNLTIAVAESCTGGLISKKITDVAGSSRVFMGGVTTYSNNSKVTLLHVPTQMIEEHGAVSEDVARAMAQGVQKLFNVNIGISTTGIAGPNGGSIEKPVGTVCFGFTINHEIYTVKEYIPGNREMVRQRSAAYALDYMRRKIKKL